MPSKPWIRRWQPLKHRWHAAALLTLVVGPLFYLTRTPPERINVDTDPVAMTAWHLVNEGTIDLRAFDTRGNPFVREYDSGRMLSNRPLGLWTLTVPAYVLSDGAYSPEPSTVLAVVITTGAVVVMLLLLWRVVEPTWAIAGTGVFALGTATWPISSSEIWPHGPGQLLLGLGLLALASDRSWLAGVASAAALLVRPVTASIAALTALRQVQRSRWRSGFAIALPVAGALVGLVVYNAWAFGNPSISGGYSSAFSENLSGSPLTKTLRHLADSLISAHNGLLLWSPIVLVAALGLKRSWSQIPTWARDGLIGGVVYFLLHARLNRASGGLPFNYRYALEPLTVAWPALVIATRQLFTENERWRRVVVVAVAASIVVQGLMAVGYECEEVPGSDHMCSIL